jgi:hypothetical protein
MWKVGRGQVLGFGALALIVVCLLGLMIAPFLLWRVHPYVAEALGVFNLVGLVWLVRSCLAVIEEVPGQYGE